MARILILLLAILLPFAAYGLWLVLERRRHRALARGERESWAVLPWGWLILSGIGLAILSFLILYAFDLDPDGWIGGPNLIRRGETAS